MTLAGASVVGCSKRVTLETVTRRRSSRARSLSLSSLAANPWSGASAAIAAKTARGNRSGVTESVVQVFMVTSCQCVELTSESEDGRKTNASPVTFVLPGFPGGPGSTTALRVKAHRVPTSAKRRLRRRPVRWRQGWTTAGRRPRQAVFSDWCAACLTPSDGRYCDCPAIPLPSGDYRAKPAKHGGKTPERQVDGAFWGDAATHGASEQRTKSGGLVWNAFVEYNTRIFCTAFRIVKRCFSIRY